MNTRQKLTSTIGAIRSIWAGSGDTFNRMQVAEITHRLERKYGTRAVESFAKRHYDAGSVNRFRDDWRANAGAPYADIRNDLVRMIARSRSEVDNNGIAQGIVNTLLTNVIATGLWPKPVVKDDKRNLIDSINKPLEEGFERFADQFDASGYGTFYENLSTVLRTEISSGTTLVNRVNNPRSNRFLHIAYQHFEPDRLDTNTDSYGYIGTTGAGSVLSGAKGKGQKIILHGIEIDEYFRPVNYYIAGRENPVSAQNMFHHYKRKRYEQIIGVPWLHASLPDLWDYRQLKEDNLIKSRILADIALWSSTDGEGAFDKDLDNSETWTWEPGSWLKSKNEPKVLQADDKVAETLKPLLKLVLLDACAGAGISYMAVSRDMDGVNFAASRTNLTEDRRYYRVLQGHLVSGYCSRIWEQYVEQMVLEGKVPGLSVSDYLADPWKYTRCNWRAEGWDWVDPRNDATASKTMYEAGLTTLEDEYAKRGRDWRDAIDQRAEEQEYAKSKGVDLLPVGGKSTINSGDGDDGDDGYNDE